MGRQRSARGRGGLTRKTGTYRSKGESRKYTYWQASRELPADALPEGVERRRVTGSGPTPTEAWKRCNANYDAVVRGEPRQGRPVPSPRVPLQGLFEQWQAVNESGAVSPVMARKYRGYFEHHVLPHLGQQKIGALGESELTLHFHQTLVRKVNDKTGKPLLAESSRRNIYMALSGCLEFAVRSGYLSTNPLRWVSPPKKREPEDDIEGALASLSPLLKVIQSPGNPDEARHLLAFLGLRRSERLGLRWRDIADLDGDRPTLHIRGQLARDSESGRLVIKPRTKSGRSRSVPLVEPFVSALKRHRERQRAELAAGDRVSPAPDHQGFLFLQPNGYPIDQNDDNEDWKRLLAAAGVPYFRGHLTRHLTAVLLSRQPEVSLSTVMAILGHNSSAMSIYYAHIDRTSHSSALSDYGRSILERPVPKNTSGQTPAT